MNEEQRLDALLNALPLEPLPAGLTARIMSEIKPLPTFIPFRLQISDLLLALACSVFMIVGLYFTVIPILQGVQPTIDFSQLGQVIVTNNLQLAFVMMLELILGCAIYLSIVEE